MGSLCDGADCFGISTALNGNTCLTNAVQCKDGVLTVPSQGSVIRRYAVGGGADYATNGAVALTANVSITNSGPRDVSGNAKLTVTVTNPFCVKAFVLINFEFAATVRAADSDQYSVGGEVSLSGTTFVEDNAAPFSTVNPQIAGPTSYGPITTYAQTPVGVADSGKVFDYVHAGAYTVMAQLNAAASCVFDGHCRVDILPRGALREIIQYNAAVTFTLTPAL